MPPAVIQRVASVSAGAAVAVAVAALSTAWLGQLPDRRAAWIPDVLTNNPQPPPRQTASSSNRLLDGDVDESGCENDHAECENWAKSGECASNPGYMAVSCKRACDACLDETERRQLKVMGCEDETPECHHWGVEGECGRNPSYMLIACPRSCNTCPLLVKAVRCRMLFGSRRRGDNRNISIDAIFERSLRDFAYLKPKVLSDGRLPTVPASNERAPWIVSFDAFASAEEVDGLLQAAAAVGYKRSTLRWDQGSWLEYLAHAVATLFRRAELAERHHFARTSHTAWCDTPDCLAHPSVRKLRRRIAAVAGGLSTENQEFLQMLRYEPGGFYRYHTDYEPTHCSQPIGPRILTVFLYLNDDFEGGETRFTNLNLSVTPKRGRAVMWPSVLGVDKDGAASPGAREDADAVGDGWHGHWHRTWKVDPRTTHEARNVLQGTKFGVNAWIHPRNFAAYMTSGCIDS